MATLDDQLRKAEEKLKQLKAKQAEQLARKRKDAKQKQDKALLSWGRALDHHLKSKIDTAKRDETLVFIRSIIDGAFPEEKQPDRQHAMQYIDHLADTLESLEQGVQTPASLPESSVVERGEVGMARR
jgi:hypothetical protein